MSVTQGCDIITHVSDGEAADHLRRRFHLALFLRILHPLLQLFELLLTQLLFPFGYAGLFVGVDLGCKRCGWLADHVDGWGRDKVPCVSLAMEFTGSGSLVKKGGPFLRCPLLQDSDVFEVIERRRQIFAVFVAVQEVCKSGSTTASPMACALTPNHYVRQDSADIGLH